MTRLVAASLLAVALSVTGAGAQEDVITLHSGTVINGVRVTAFDIRNLRYTKGNANEMVPSDQIAKVDLRRFADVYRRGLRDPDLMLTVARERLADKDLLLAQFGFVGAAAQFFDANEPAKAVGALDELQKGIPEAGLLPEIHRQKFEYYMGLGAKGAANAAAVAKKYQADATGGAWPNGFAIEADFFLVLAERRDPKDFQSRLRSVVQKAGGTMPLVANRANVELAHSLRETKDNEGARRIYEEIIAKDNADASARAGAYLGLGRILLETASAGDKDAFKKAMLLFLRVRLETKDCWPALQAEALYHAMLAAQKWQGPEFGLVIARCRSLLQNEFRDSEWAERARR